MSTKADSLSSIKANVQSLNISEAVKCFEFTMSGIIFTVFFLFFLFLMIRRERKENKEREIKKLKDIIYIRNLWWTLRWFSLIFCLIGALYSFNVFHVEFRYPFVSKVDGIIWFMTIVGIIGAIWAVFARIDAERAFNQSKKTYDALGATFDFISFFENDKFPELLETIGEKNYEQSVVTLYIGFPCVGLLYKENEKLKKNGPIELFLKLITKLRSIKDNLIMDISIPYTLKMGCFDENVSNIILKGITSISKEEKIKIESLLTEFYTLFRTIQTYNNPKLKFITINESEKFRFASINPNFSKPINEVRKKAYTWIVRINQISENGETKFQPFDSFVFQTSEDRFIALLEEVF